MLAFGQRQGAVRCAIIGLVDLPKRGGEDASRAGGCCRPCMALCGLFRYRLNVQKAGPSALANRRLPVPVQRGNGRPKLISREPVRPIVHYGTYLGNQRTYKT